MAERRMFSKTIIDSDLFLDMPLSSQALYFHLSMRADDEGFINNPKKIMRMIGTSEDDMRILVARKFIIPFDSGVVVIKHWKIHNYIRADRLIKTQHQSERDMLTESSNGEYEFLEGGVEEIEDLDASDIRKMAYKRSSLPYSFSYKMKRAFDGKECPICHCIMLTSNHSKMPSIQHNIPISKGGVHELENISVVCLGCNSSTRDKETPNLNNAEVVETWDRIMYAENHGIDWFRNPEILDNIECQSDVRQVSVNCPSNVSIGKDRLGKDSIDKDSVGVGEAPTPTDAEMEQIMSAWNNTPGVVRIRNIAPMTRRWDELRICMNMVGTDGVLEAIDKLRDSKYLQRRGNIVFDRFINRNAIQNLLEGAYDKDFQEGEKHGSIFD